LVASPLWSVCHFFMSFYLHHPHLPSFPTRRSSDLWMSRPWFHEQRMHYARRVTGRGPSAHPAQLSSSTSEHESSILRKPTTHIRSEEHTSELQSLAYLVCRLLLEKKKTHTGRS